MKKQVTLAIATLVVMVSCKPNHEQSPLSFAPKVVEAHGYVVPKDSMAAPEVIPAGKPKVVLAGKPKVVLTNTQCAPSRCPQGCSSWRT